MKLPFKVYPSLLKTNKKKTQTDLCTQIRQNNILSPRNFWNSKSNEIGSASSQVGVEGADRHEDAEKARRSPRQELKPAPRANRAKHKGRNGKVDNVQGGPQHMQLFWSSRQFII